MRPTIALIVILGSLSQLAGCATPPKYDWGKYDASLYAYYKNPAKAPELIESLQRIIQVDTARKAMVGPGIYAEYGYLLMQQGKLQEAIEAFNEEARRWPESKVFMDRMIVLATEQPVVAKSKEL